MIVFKEERSEDAPLAELHLARLDAFRRWLALYQERDSLTDPDKRRHMLEARLRYQDALLCYASASRRH